MATEEIKKLIIAGELKPGDRLLEIRLAEQLGISRPPLREAMRALAAKDILALRPRRGYHVVELTGVDIDEIYTLRNSLEQFALELTLARLPFPSLHDVEVAMQEMSTAAEAGNGAQVVLANRKFHEAIVALAGHTRLSTTYRTLMDQMQLCMSQNLRQEAQLVGDLTEGCRRHDRLLQSFRSGDPVQIRAAVHHHGERTYLAAVADRTGGDSEGAA